MNDVFKFEGTLFERRRELCLMAWSETALVGRAATLSDIEVALAEKGLCVVQAPGPQGVTARAQARLRGPLDGADAQALEHALAIAEREQDELIAGQHSRDEEIARLMARVAELEQEATELEGMLADKALDSARIASELTDQLEATERRVEEFRAELASCRKVVEAALRLRAKMARDDEGRPLIDNFAGSDFDDLDGACAIYEIGLTHEPERNAAERAALASAGKDSGEAQPAPANADDVIALVHARIPGKRLGVGGPLPRYYQETLAAAGKDSGEGGPYSRLWGCPVCGLTKKTDRPLFKIDCHDGHDWVAMIPIRETLGKDGAGSAGAAVGNEAGTEGDIASPSGFKHSAQPAPSEPAKCAHYQHKWLYRRDLGKNQCMGCRELMPEPAESAKPPNHPGIPESSNPSKSSNGSPEPTATVPREPGCQCHWEVGDSPCRVHGEDEAEPAATVPRGEVEALRELVRVQAYVQDVDLTKWDEYKAALEKAKALLDKDEVKS